MINNFDYYTCPVCGSVHDTELAGLVMIDKEPHHVDFTCAQCGQDSKYHCIVNCAACEYAPTCPMRRDMPKPRIYARGYYRSGLAAPARLYTLVWNGIIRGDYGRLKRAIEASRYLMTGEDNHD